MYKTYELFILIIQNHYTCPSVPVERVSYLCLSAVGTSSSPDTPSVPDVTESTLSKILFFICCTERQIRCCQVMSFCWRRFHMVGLNNG